MESHNDLLDKSIKYFREICDVKVQTSNTNCAELYQSYNPLTFKEIDDAQSYQGSKEYNEFLAASATVINEEALELFNKLSGDEKQLAKKEIELHAVKLKFFGVGFASAYEEDSVSKLNNYI
jgi:hypothetical protein